MNRRFLTFLLLFFSFLMIQNLILTWQQNTKEVSFDYILNLLEKQQVSKAIITQDQLKVLVKEDDSQTWYYSNRVDPEMLNLLKGQSIEFEQKQESEFFKNLLSWIIPPLLFVGLWFYFMRRFAAKNLGGSMMNVGKSKAKIFVETDTKVNFDDIAGVDEAKEEMQEVVNFLKDQKKSIRLGARMPKGILLVGPPGTGKTLFARAIAGEAGVPFFSISGSEFVEMFVGVGAARVRDLFEQARKHSPCIVFIDELDALGKARGAAHFGGGNDEKEQTLNQLLTELDGFDAQSGILLLAATNRPEILDPALLRAGRFDRQVLVDRPDKNGRMAILKVHIKKIQMAPDLNLQEIADLTTGFTGADLANLVNEAALMATKKQKKEVELEDFQLALERIIGGLERKSRLLNAFERKVVAYHEMGHALVALSLEQDQVVHKVSIIPRGMGALGYTIQRPTEDRFLMKKEELENKIAILLAGRAAEELIFQHRSTGAADDLVRATDLAHRMVTQYGMEGEFSHMSLQRQHNQFLNTSATAVVNYSEATAAAIDQAVMAILDRCYQKAMDLLKTRRSDLESYCARLLQTEVLTAEDLRPLRRG